MARPGCGLYLRLYTWSARSITFGRNQKLEKAFSHDRLGDTPAIRRLTGGRALLHDPSELTYSITVDREGDVPSQLVGKSAAFGDFVAEGLVSFLESLGKRAEYAPNSSSSNAKPETFHSAPCFESHARSEVISEGRKTIASAAFHDLRYSLQHGSIKLHGISDHPALSLPPQPDSQVPDSASIGLSEFDLHSRSFADAMAHTLRLKIEPISLPPDELSVVQQYREVLKKQPFSRRDIFKHGV